MVVTETHGFESRLGHPAEIQALPEFLAQFHDRAGDLREMAVHIGQAYVVVLSE